MFVPPPARFVSFTCLRRRRLPAIVVASLFALACAGASGAEPSPASFFGDVRLRYEWDWDSQTATGGRRTDRDRARVRTRVGMDYRFSSEWLFGTRVRTGSRDSQQSPHLTFSANDGLHDDLELAFDRYYLQFKRNGFTGWAGRNVSPFWQQNELFWDEDVTPTGVAGTFETAAGTGRLTTTAGAFLLPDGMTHLNGRLLAIQTRYGAKAGAGQLTLAAGLHHFDGENGAKNLRNRNGARDYTIGTLSGQWSMPVSGHPLAFGVDLMKNFQDYSAGAAAPLAPSNADETFGVVLALQLGQLKQPHDWLLGWYYAHIETFAANASFAQDDWARFGSATQSDLTDIEGHELRFGYAITKNLNLVSRLFLVEAITTRQDGKRFRVDLNWKF